MIDDFDFSVDCDACDCSSNVFYVENKGFICGNCEAKISRDQILLTILVKLQDLQDIKNILGEIGGQLTLEFGNKEF